MEGALAASLGRALAILFPTAGAIVAVIALIGAALGWRWIIGKISERDVRLTIDEGAVIVQVAEYAMQRLDAPPPWKNSPTVLVLRSTDRLLGLLPFFRRISRDDLAFLAPYIDDWIAGKAPPQSLPAEYYDWRPDALRSFKDRMMREDLWPRVLRNESS